MIIQIRGHVCRFILIDRDKLCKSTDSPISWTREDSISNLESSDAFPDFDDFTCAIMPQDKRESIRSQKAKVAIAQFKIDWIDTCGVNLHQDVRETGFRCRKSSNPKNLVPSISIDASANHVNILFVYQT